MTGATFAQTFSFECPCGPFGHSEEYHASQMDTERKFNRKTMIMAMMAVACAVAFCDSREDRLADLPTYAHSYQVTTLLRCVRRT